MSGDLVPVSGMDLLERVAAYADREPEELATKNMHAPVHRVRFAVAFAMHQVWRLSASAIGRSLRRDHSTILHAIRRANDLREVDAEFREVLDYACAEARTNPELAARRNGYVDRTVI